MDKKRIAIYIPILDIGGAERVMLILAGGFLKKGYAVDLVLSKKTGLLLKLVPIGVRIIDLDGKRMLPSIWPLAQYLRREHPDAIISGLDIANIIVVCARLLAFSKTRILLTIHSHMSFLAKDSGRIRDRVYPWLLHLFYRYAYGIIAISKGAALEASLSAGIPPSKIQVVNNPIDLNNILQLSYEKVDHPWFNGENEIPVILTVGRLTSAKDLPTLLRSFWLLCQQRSARLVIIGDGDECSKLVVLASELGITKNVYLPGFDLNPYRYMSHSNVFVLSSYFEGFANVLVEALACGTQVVSTNCPSGPAEILEDGKHGRLVPVGDTAALAGAIADALDYPLPIEGLKERAKAFSSEAAVSAYLQALGFPINDH
jgi:glycosyltransferase involved in cell wall biosynthesis